MRPVIVSRMVEPPNRHSIRLNSHDYTNTGPYFITLCSHGRKPLFGEVREAKIHLSRVGVIVQEEWSRTSLVRPEVTLDEFVVMPNHLHGIVFLGTPE